MSAGFGGQYYEEEEEEQGTTFASPNRPARDQRGNLLGGRQNASMQAYQMEETLEEKEHRRWLAHKDATLHATFPTELKLNGVAIPIARYDELTGLGQKRARLRALDLRDLLASTGSNFLEHFGLQLNPYSSGETLTRWILDVQVALASALGEDPPLDHAAFGAPASFLNATRPTPMAQRPPSRRNRPCWSQAGVNDGRSMPAPEQYTAQPQSFPWSQHGIGLQTGQHRQGMAQYDGFSLVPPPFGQEPSRFNDAAHIIRRGHGSSIVLG